MHQFVDANTALIRSRVRAHASAAHAAAATTAAADKDERPDRGFARLTAADTVSAQLLFSPGQDPIARQSVETAIKHQPTPKEGVLWGAGQSSWAQAERESDNVRRLLQADGMTRWRPDLHKMPPQRPADASMEVVLTLPPVTASTDRARAS